MRIKMYIYCIYDELCGRRDCGYHVVLRVIIPADSNAANTGRLYRCGVVRAESYQASVCSVR